MDVPPLIPVLAVEDIKEAIDFYSKLGLVEEKEYTFVDDIGTIVHAQLRKGSSVFFLGRRDVLYYRGTRADRISKSDHSERGLGVTFIFQTEKIEDVLKIVKDAGLEILYGPADEWYGDKVFLFVDPFGYEWKISQPSLGE